jgi:glucuronoarabinoxylan endo-1,4-beta-xylanase
MQQNYSSKWIHNTVKISILILFQIFISFVLVAQTVTVNLNQQAQLIRGFGGINHPTWYSDLNAAERELAFGNGPGQLGLTVLRTYV